MRTPPSPIGLFEGIGIELEYMIVDRDTLDILPIADLILKEIAGDFRSQVEVGPLAWSNELVLHVLELKTNGPAKRLQGLENIFLEDIARINRMLEPMHGRLMPTAVHPWMDPWTEMKLWPHEHNPIYESYNRIFDCRGHGWANLQSTHVNLPFAKDDEFGRLHAATRLLLPIMPALAAASPIVEKKVTGSLDYRMEAYLRNSARIPSLTGSLIPEAVYSRGDYETKLLGKLYADIRPYDPEGILQYEWLNSRGAIARFDRHALEIRVLDVQETPKADLAITWAIVEALKAIITERWLPLEDQMSWPLEPLRKISLDVIKDAEQATIEDIGYLEAFGYDGPRPCSARMLWSHLLDSFTGVENSNEFRGAVEFILEKGTLARRILKSVGNRMTPGRLREVYESLCGCLAEGVLFSE